MAGLEYMLNTYKFSSEATITQTGSNEFGNYIILDTTIFYPQGGGQPTDIGTIQSGDTKIDVVNVRADENGNIFHYISGDHVFSPGDQVSLHVDETVRRFNARNHSAGHLLSEAIKNIGYGHIISTKGFHFPKGAYVEYATAVPPEEKQEFIDKLEGELARIIQTDMPMIVEHEDLQEGEIPTKDIKRTARFEGLKGCGCGGTHVKSTGEIGAIKIRKIKNIKGAMRVSYDISEY